MDLVFTVSVALHPVENRGGRSGALSLVGAGLSLASSPRPPRSPLMALVIFLGCP